MKCLISLLGVAGMVVYAFASNAQTTSVRSGKWSSPSTWSNGIVPDASSGPIVINHDVDIAEDTLLTADQLTINATLTIKKNATLVLEHDVSPDLQIVSGTLDVYGRVICRDSAVITGTSSANTFFHDSSTYEHQYFNTAGEPPTAFWSNSSTLEFTGYLTGKSLSSLRWNQEYGNIVYNCSSQRSGTFVEMLGNIHNVKGNFIVKSTGAGMLRITLDKTALTTINIGGNYYIEGTSRVWMSRSANTTINVSGDFHYRSTATASSYLTTQGTGTLNVSGNVVINTVGILRFASSGGGTGTMRVGKNFDITTGTLTVAAPGQGKIVLQGDVPQSINLLGNITTGINIEIANTHGVTFAEDSRTAGNILVNSGAEMRLPEGTFTLEGDLDTEGGAEIYAPGTLRLAGAVNQIVNVHGDTINHFHVTKPSGTLVTIGSPLRLRGVMTLGSSGVTVNSDGNLMLISTADSPDEGGSVASIPDGSVIQGDVTVQRYMSGEGRIYRYLSSPVANASVAQWQDDFPVTGTFEDPSNGGGLNESGPSLFHYDETSSGDGWRNYPEAGLASENPLLPGRGYSAFIRKANAATTLDVTGTLNQHEVAFAVSYTQTTDTLYDGWNLIGNPYPSAIDWDRESGWTKFNISNKIAIRDNGTGTFKYWDGSVGNLNNGVIATGQAFWVQATGATPSLNIRESAKAGIPAIFYRKRNEVTDFIKVTLSGRALSDETFLRLDNTGNPGFDKQDVVKWSNDILNFSFAIDSLPVAIDVRNQIASGASIPFLLNLARKPDGSIDPKYLGQYTLRFNTLGLFNYTNIQLTDHYVDTTFSPGIDPYHFVLNNNPDSFDPRRFTISVLADHHRDSLAVEIDTLVCAASDDPKITIRKAQAGRRYDCWLNGVFVATRLVTRDSIIRFSLLKDQLRLGENKIRIVARNVSGVTGEEDVIIKKVVNIDAPFLIDRGTTILSSYNVGDWYLNEEKIAENTSTLMPQTSGTYRQVININGCIAQGEIEFLAQGISWRCYPVPTSRYVFITAPVGVYIEQVKVLTSTGTVVRHSTFKNGSKEIELDTTGLDDGVYFATVSTRDKTRTVRFVKKSE